MSRIQKSFAKKKASVDSYDLQLEELIICFKN